VYPGAPLDVSEKGKGEAERQNERDVKNCSKCKRKEKSWDKRATICEIDVVITVQVKIKLLLKAKYLPRYWVIVVFFFFRV